MKKLIVTIASFCMLQQMKAQDTKIIAHRGAWKEFNLPENSIAALQKAIEIKAFGSEFDVRRTLDGKLVVNHDPTHFGDTIELKTYAALNAKKLSNGEDLPLLQDYFKKGTASNHHTLLICEIKAALLSNSTSQLTASETVELAKQLGIAKKQHLMLGSWTVNKDEDFNHLLEQGIQYITTNFPERYLMQLDHKH